ncbi:4-alpha-glucanotransferase, partial [Bacillus safensis]|uniref:4-alpha-glucanotransferase n=1 Tax=Bacillus safensis TaxID=561879 RepID=UPI002DD434B2
LAILALESQRAKAYVVGEDLGTVEPAAHEKLAQHRLLSYRLLWFEKNPPESYPCDSLAAVTTHDLPTVAGLWTGSDLRKQRKLHLKPNEEST